MTWESVTIENHWRIILLTVKNECSELLSSMKCTGCHQQVFQHTAVPPSAPVTSFLQHQNVTHLAATLTSASFLVTGIVSGNKRETQSQFFPSGVSVITLDFTFNAFGKLRVRCLTCRLLHHKNLLISLPCLLC